MKTQMKIEKEMLKEMQIKMEIETIVRPIAGISRILETQLTSTFEEAAMRTNKFNECATVEDLNAYMKILLEQGSFWNNNNPLFGLEGSKALSVMESWAANNLAKINKDFPLLKPLQ